MGTKLSVKFAIALAGLLLACLGGEIFWLSDPDLHGKLAIPPAFIYIFIVLFASPFWLFTFVLPFLLASPKSFFWRWYFAPPLGALIGFLAGMIVLAMTVSQAGSAGNQPPEVDRLTLTPALIGFLLFLVGSLFNGLVAEPSSDQS